MTTAARTDSPSARPAVGRPAIRKFMPWEIPPQHREAADILRWADSQARKRFNAALAAYGSDQSAYWQREKLAELHRAAFAMMAVAMGKRTFSCVLAGERPPRLVAHEIGSAKCPM